MRLPQSQGAAGLDPGPGADLCLAPSALARAVLVCGVLRAGRGGAGARDPVTGEVRAGSAAAPAVLPVENLHLDTRRRAFG